MNNYVIVAVVSKIVLVIAGYLYIFYIFGFPCFRRSQWFPVDSMCAAVGSCSRRGWWWDFRFGRKRTPPVGTVMPCSKCPWPPQLRLPQPYLQNPTGNLQPPLSAFELHVLGMCRLDFHERPATTRHTGVLSGLGTGFFKWSQLGPWFLCSFQCLMQKEYGRQQKYFKYIFLLTKIGLKL